MSAMKGHRHLWHTYASQAEARGRLTADLLARWLALPGARIIDAGCGRGGSSRALAAGGARVTAIDLPAEPPELLHPDRSPVRYLSADLCRWQGDESADAVLLWDVLEHLPSPDLALQACSRALRSGGLLLISTPNRNSVANLFCDPHYGLPLVALMRRRAVRRVIANWLHWHPPDKPDFPQLLSLNELAALLQRAGFSWRFIHHDLFAAAMAEPQRLWSRSWHLRLFRLIRQKGWDPALDRLLSDRPDWRNRWLMPTWFILARREERP